MAKEKAKKGVPNKHLHARIAYLHQAANYLSFQSLAKSPGETRQNEECTREKNSLGAQMAREPPGTLAIDATTATANSRPSHGHPSTATFNPPPSGLPLQLTAHMRSVAQKAQIRLSRDLKHSFCKICSSPLIEGETCIRSTENLSKNGRKPWADVLVLKCCACGACKRFPVGATKQKRKSLRGHDAKNEIENGVADAVVNKGSANEHLGTEDATEAVVAKDSCAEA